MASERTCWKCGNPTGTYRGTATGKGGRKYSVTRSVCCRVILPSRAAAEED